MSDYPSEIWLVSSGDSGHASNWIATSGPHGERYVRANLFPSDDAIKAIELIVDVACESARKSKEFSHESINWGDLCCVGVGAMDGNYLVFIEEASPNCPDFQQYVYEKLATAGYENVEVRTEW